MSTQADLDSATKLDLKICPDCGWYTDNFNHVDRCKPIAGKRADELIDEVTRAALISDRTPIIAGKLGYGIGYAYFEVDPDFVLRFEVSDTKRDAAPFSIEEVWTIDDLTRDEASDFVTMVIAWRRRMLEARKRRG